MVTSSGSVNLMKGQLNYLVKAGYDVTVVTSPGAGLYEAIRRENVKLKEIKMERTIHPLKDFFALIKIIFFFLKVKPDICNAGTPKAGLLGMIAAKITRVPFKVYTVRGMPLESTRGIKRRILMKTEKIACMCADKVVCISPSLREALIKYKITYYEKTVLFGKGSSNGLQLSNYKFTNEMAEKINEIRTQHKLNKYNFIVGSVGRINKDKGIKEAILAFENLQKKCDNVCLILVGVKEKNNAISNEINDRIVNNPDIIEVGKVKNPIPYYYLMDVLIFPTYREGFGNVSIEAQATGTPVITTNVTGAKDTIIPNETGYLIDVRSVASLENAITEFIENPDLSERLGGKGKEWVSQNFNSELIWNNLNELYKNGTVSK